MKNEQREIACRAVEKYGPEAQLRQLQEEAAELVVSISHYLRRRETGLAELLEEIGDVYVMLEQTRVIFKDKTIETACKISNLKLKGKLV